MKLTYATLQTAQQRADKLHADMIASNPLYAESAALYNEKTPERGGTARWCFPEQIGAQWAVIVDERVMPVLAAAELQVVLEPVLIVDEEPLP